MSLAQSICEKYGHAIKAPGFVKKLPAVNAPERLVRLLKNYVDETTKCSRTLPPTESNLDDKEHCRRIVDRMAPLRPGVDYVTEFPHVMCFGHAALALGQITGKLASEPTPEELTFLAEWWLSQTATHKKKAFHLIFSIDPRMMLDLAPRGVAADGVMLSAMLESLLVFGGRHYPGEIVGGVLGCHFDRHHPHAHVLLFPRTDTGDRINLSRLSPGKIDGVATRIDYQGSLQLAFHREGVSLLETLSTPLPVPISEVCRQWLLVRSLANARSRESGDTGAAGNIDRMLQSPYWLHQAEVVAAQYRRQFAAPRRPTEDETRACVSTIGAHKVTRGAVRDSITVVEELMAAADSAARTDSLVTELARLRQCDGQLAECTRIIAHDGLLLAGLVRGRVPFFLETGSRTRALLTPEELRQRCRAQIRQHAARERFDRRPFSPDMAGVLQYPPPEWMRNGELPPNSDWATPCPLPGAVAVLPPSLEKGQQVERTDTILRSFAEVQPQLGRDQPAR